MTGELHASYRSYLDALNAHDFDRMDEFVHERATFNGAWITRDEMIAAQRELVAAVPDFAWRLDDLLVDDDRVAARLTITGTPVRHWLGRTPTGDTFEVTEYGMYEARGGRFEHLRNLVDVDALRGPAAPRDTGR